MRAGSRRRSTQVLREGWLPGVTCGNTAKIYVLPMTSTTRLLLRVPFTIVCALVWVDFVIRGVCFPLVVHDTRTSWGGPTMAGAWAVHFGLLALILAALHGIAYALSPKTAQR